MISAALLLRCPGVGGWVNLRSECVEAGRHLGCDVGAAPVRALKNTFSRFPASSVAAAAAAFHFCLLESGKMALLRVLAANHCEVCGRAQVGKKSSSC